MNFGTVGRGVVLGLAACAIATAAPVPASAADAPEWAVDAKSSTITFTGRQMNVPTDGKFQRFTAKVRFDPANLGGSAVEVTIQTGSARTGNKDIDLTLESDNFFEVKRFPTARFVATSFTAKGGNKYEAAAKLTIRGISQDVVLPFTLDIAEKGGEMVAKVAGEVALSRTKFGIGRGEWSNTKVIADKVVVRIEVTARRKK